jgi:hypothetical protein
VNVNTLNRMVAADLISSVLFVGMSISTYGQQPQQQAVQLQQVAPERLRQQPQPQLTQYRQPVDLGQRADRRVTPLKKRCFHILKSLGGHIKPLPSASADMSPWQKRG